MGNGPGRLVVEAEALAWMDANAAAEGTSVLTSLPDVSELPHLDLAAWRAWFGGAARRILRWVPAAGVAIFYQSDVRRGAEWIDKGYLVLRAADDEGATVLWHKIVCRRPPGTIALGRPSYAHMIAVTREPRAAPRRPGPDVLPDAGFMPWSRAIGVEACRVACRFLLDETATRVVVDPFCGRGTVLAIANAMGLASIGVDLSAKRCRAARALVLGGAPEADALRAGARLFDAGAFWEAHEVWEGRWRVTTEPTERLHLQGLIQVAAAFHKLLVMESPQAAGRLLARGLAKLQAAPADPELARFREGLETCARGLAVGLPFDRALIPRLGPT